MIFHDLKDIVMIYSSTQEGKPDYSWDKAEIAVWDPKRQVKGRLCFTGSSKPDNQINFNIDFKEDVGPDVFEAFDLVYDEMKKTNFNTHYNWRKRFLEILTNNRLKNNEDGKK